MTYGQMSPRGNGLIAGLVVDVLENGPMPVAGEEDKAPRPRAGARGATKLDKPAVTTV